MGRNKRARRGATVEADVTSAPIAGFSLYRVTDDGRVYNTRSNEYLTPDLPNSGYYRVKLFDDTGKRRGAYIHRLVALGYVANPLSLEQVHHINHDKLDNHRDNLIWVTSSQNNLYTRDAGRHSMHILTMSDAAEIRERSAAGEPQKDIAADYDICQANVSRVVTNRTWHDPDYTPPDRSAGLSDDDVRDIRLLVANGVKARALATRYGICDSYVRHIARGERRTKKTATGE